MLFLHRSPPLGALLTLVCTVCVGTGTVTQHKQEVMDAGVVYYHLRQQGRVIDHAAPLGTSHGAEMVARVDTSSDDLGYSAWFREHWTAMVVSPQKEAALTVQRVYRGFRVRAWTRQEASWRGATPGGAPAAVPAGVLDGLRGGYAPLVDEGGEGHHESQSRLHKQRQRVDA